MRRWMKLHGNSFTVTLSSEDHTKLMTRVSLFLEISFCKFATFQAFCALNIPKRVPPLPLFLNRPVDGIHANG